MTKNSLFLVLLFGICLNHVFAQTITTQKGLTTAVFNLPEGDIKLYLPDDIRPGDMISGTIQAVPDGKNAKQTSRNLAALKKYSVEFDGQKYPVSEVNNHVQYKINHNRLLQRPLAVFNNEGVNAGETSITCNYTAVQKPAADCAIPTHALTAAPLRITGPFDGNSSNTQCNVDGREAEILAESPRQCIVQFPANSGGMQTIKLQENNQQKCAGTISGVDMQVSSGKLNLLKGEKTYIKVEITGLQNLPDTARLSIVNTTADVVQMQPSNSFLVLLSPDSVANGVYVKIFDVQSVKTGNFSVNVDLDLPQPQPLKDIYTDVPKTNNDIKTDTVPCKNLEEQIKAAEEALEKLKTELAGIDNLINAAQQRIEDCNKILKGLLDAYHAKKRIFDDRDNTRKNWEKNGMALTADKQEKLKQAKDEMDAAAKEWSEQNKKCRVLEAELAALKARKAALPGLIDAASGDLKGAKDDLEKCKTKAVEDKKKKEAEERNGTGTQPLPADGNSNPGTGADKAGSPCNPEGAILIENKRIYGDCYAADISLQPCNMSKFDNDVVNALKKILEKIKPLAKPLEIAEKIAECSSTAKAVCVNFHIKSDWEDVELKYECINGKWVLMNRKSINKGTVDHGNFTVNDPENGVCCWVFGKKEDGEKVMESHLAQAIENLLMAKGCK